MIGPKLHDEVTFESTIVGSDRPDDMTVPAHVYSVAGNIPNEQNRPGLLITAMRAMVGPVPRPLDAIDDHVWHRGIQYRIEAPPMGRYRRGKIHHWTIDLERVTG